MSPIKRQNRWNSVRKSLDKLRNGTFTRKEIARSCTLHSLAFHCKIGSRWRKDLLDLRGSEGTSNHEFLPVVLKDNDVWLLSVELFGCRSEEGSRRRSFEKAKISGARMNGSIGNWKGIWIFHWLYNEFKIDTKVEREMLRKSIRREERIIS